MTKTSAQAFLYLQASVIGTLCNFFSRFAFSEWFSFGISVVLANYVGMVIVFCLSYRRAFGMCKATVPMMIKFAIVAHIGLLIVWLVSTGFFHIIQGLFPPLLSKSEAFQLLETSFPGWKGNACLSAWIPSLTEGFCHGAGILAGFIANFFGHKKFSFAHSRSACVQR